MACCAFAAFIIGQILFACDRFRAALGLRVDPDQELAATSSVAWNPGQAGAHAEKQHSPRRRRIAIGMVAVELLMAVVFIAGSHDEHELRIIATLCRASSFSKKGIFKQPLAMVAVGPSGTHR